jgi:hypothetical protein
MEPAAIAQEGRKHNLVGSDQENQKPFHHRFPPVTPADFMSETSSF